MDLQKLEKAHRIFMIGCAVALTGIAFYANRTQKKMMQEQADFAARIIEMDAKAKQKYEELRSNISKVNNL